MRLMRPDLFAKTPIFRHLLPFQLFCLILVSAALSMAAKPVHAAPEVGLQDAFVVDPRTGAALFGFDPVAYFIDGKAIAGEERLSLLWGGMKWRFASVHNLEIFQRAPEAYLPRIGGLDPLRLADGFRTAADPRIFLIDGEVLWLFRNERSRAQFLADPSAKHRAQANWTGDLFAKGKDGTKQSSKD
jgi:hypothetical protein